MDVLHIERLLHNRRYNWWVVAAKMHCSSFPISHLCELTRITWKYRSYMVLQIEQLLYYWRHSLCGLDLHERSDWRTTAPPPPQTLIGNSLIFCYLVRNYMYDNKSHLPWLHTTHLITVLLPIMYRFLQGKLTSYTTRCSVFSIIRARKY